MQWKILYSDPATAQENMDRDHRLLQEIAADGQPTIHFYEWIRPSVTYGYFINPSRYFSLDGLKKAGISLGHRPTGGGIVFHMADLAFSIIVPASCPAYSMNTLENYAFVNKRVAQAVVNLKKEITTTLLSKDQPSDIKCKNFCMANPTIYDVMVEGKKVGGAAQRKTREGFLHQGTLSLAMSDENLIKAILKEGNQVLEEMRRHSYPLLESPSNVQQLKHARNELQQLLISEFLRET